MPNFSYDSLFNIVSKAKNCTISYLQLLLAHFTNINLHFKLNNSLKSLEEYNNENAEKSLFSVLIEKSCFCLNKITNFLKELVDIEKLVKSIFDRFFSDILFEGLNNLRMPKNQFFRGCFEGLRIFFRLHDFLTGNDLFIKEEGFYKIREEVPHKENFNKSKQVIKFTKPAYKAHVFTDRSDEKFKRSMYFFVISTIAYSSVFIISYYVLRVMFKGFKYLNMRRLCFFIMAALMVCLKMYDSIIL